MSLGHSQGWTRRETCGRDQPSHTGALGLLGRGLTDYGAVEAAEKYEVYSIPGDLIHTNGFNSEIYTSSLDSASQVSNTCI